MLEKNCEGCRFHKFPYKIQSPVKSKGIYPLVTFNNKDDIWEVTMQLINEYSSLKFHDMCYSISRQIYYFSCPNIFKTNNFIEDINRYYYCKDMGVPPYEGSYNKQPAKWVEKYYIIKGAFSKLEEVHIKKSNSKKATHGS